MSDPRNHNEFGKYKYLVHGVQIHGTYYDENAYQNPEKFLKRAKISASMVTNYCNATYTPSGIILKVPADSIVYTTPFMDAATNDIYTGRSTLRGTNYITNWQFFLKKAFSLEPLNEVVIKPNRTGSGEKISIVGVFFSEPLAQELTEENRTLVRQFAKDYSVPIVVFRTPKRLLKARLRQIKDGYSVN